MPSPIVFLDFETTGLTTDDEPWEFAAVRREPDGSATALHTFIQHDSVKAHTLPQPFQLDYAARFDPKQAITPAEFALWVRPLFEGRPHVIGAVPDFDTRHLRKLLGTNGWTDPWHYHLVDVETLVVGYLRGLRAAAIDDRLITDGDDILPSPSLPWDSDELSRAMGVEPPGEGVRHTALGDVRWTMQLWDTVMGPWHSLQAGVA